MQHPTDTFKASLAAERRALLVPWIDATWRVIHAELSKEADAQDPDEYDRLWRVADGLLMVYCNGDEAWAKALKDAWQDSQESLTYYTTQFTRDQLVYNSNTFKEEDREALERRLGLWDDEVSDALGLMPTQDEVEG